MIVDKKIVISCSNSGSLINFRGQLIKTLLERNKVYVITPRISDPQIKEALLELGVSVYEINLKRNSISIFYDFLYLLDLYRIIKRLEPDVFFAYTFKPVVYGAFVTSFFRIENVIGMLTGLGYSFSESANGVLSFITRQVLGLSFRFNRKMKIILQNADDLRELVGRDIIGKHNYAFVVDGSGVDLAHYNYSLPDVTNINFIMVSRLLNSKGVKEYFQAASILKHKYPEVTFTLAGGYEKGGIDSIEEDLFNEIKTGNVVQYLGWVNDIRYYLQKSTTVVLPSFYREGVPRSLLEALAMGRPIITTDTIGCKETICTTPGYENGFCIPIRSTESLFERMEHLIKHPDEIVFLGKNGRLLAERRFDVHKVNKRMIEIFGMNTLTGTGLLVKN